LFITVGIQNVWLQKNIPSKLYSFWWFVKRAYYIKLEKICKCILYRWILWSSYLTYNTKTFAKLKSINIRIVFEPHIARPAIGLNFGGLCALLSSSVGVRLRLRLNCPPAPDISDRPGRCSFVSADQAAFSVQWCRCSTARTNIYHARVHASGRWLRWPDSNARTPVAKISSLQSLHRCLRVFLGQSSTFRSGHRTLNRSVSRRLWSVCCATIFSDCGTNFIGADKQLKCLVNSPAGQDAIAQARSACHWHFTPPPQCATLWWPLGSGGTVSETVINSYYGYTCTHIRGVHDSSHSRRGRTRIINN